nr:4Fe-4S dicluster domain-containing protein [Tessaracoccus flavus]
MTKCDLCRDRLAVGEKPACVAACPSRALDFGEIEDLRQRYGSEAGIEPLPDPRITQPNLVIKPHPAAQSSGQGTGRIESMTRVD